ncbi:DUF1989 domain-containing protein [Gelidibacter pelagius]|uniref:DUF1989 domain-containing protein n=1 Tax=Gelidibacter pelagius TaxID=2819985 RepID=A0ABS3STP2_9FLAO|nr:DUF1989 domain-containing protein [Gelidibacter pelagius]
MKLHRNLLTYGIGIENLPTAFSIVMNVQFDKSGELKVVIQTSKAGGLIHFRTITDLVVGLTSCSAKDSIG